jgi:hypothetical protein
MTSVKIMTSQMFDGPNWELQAERLREVLVQACKDLRGGAQSDAVADYIQMKLSAIK